jgi:hypothetical protein
MDIGTEEMSPARIDRISFFKTRLPKRYKATVYSLFRKNRFLSNLERPKIHRASTP